MLIDSPPVLDDPKPERFSVYTAALATGYHRRTTSHGRALAGFFPLYVQVAAGQTHSQLPICPPIIPNVSGAPPGFQFVRNAMMGSIREALLAGR